MDTIFALSTPPGRGGVAVIRISGPSVDVVCQRFELGKLAARVASLRDIRDGADILDEALVIRFDGSASFTGEEVLELQIHGSLAVREAVMTRLERLEGCRPALPGEFTRRALENGRMDISEVEGLSALIDAETEAQRQQAQRVFSGGLGQIAETWRSELIQGLALLEVTIDFSDEEVPVDVVPDVRKNVGRVVDDLKREAAGSLMAERVREGFEVAIVGAPNAGKSTLLNAMAGRNAAITSEIEGTTRDVIEVRMDLDGLPVTFLDTAGLRHSEDAIEQMGVEVASKRAAEADLRVFLLSNREMLDVVGVQDDDIHIWGKGDLKPENGKSVSGLTGSGIDDLIRSISEKLRLRTAAIGTATHSRHRSAMLMACDHLEYALAELSNDHARQEIAAEHIRRALAALDALVGRVDVEVILDEIFSRFCLGK